jgi:ABC-type multidrug transport system ATPase subunit
MCLRIEPGEIFGLLGPNGAGKTTLISMLTGLYSSTMGGAWISGFDIGS